MPEADRLPAISTTLRTAARRFGTPVLVTDLATIDASVAAVAAAFPDPWIRHYSVKANDVAAIVRAVCDAPGGFGANVVSRGEWAIASRSGLPNERITFEGIGKTDADLRAVVRASRDGRPLRWLAVESRDELAVLAGLAGRARLERPIDVLLRLNPDVAPETHDSLAVGRGASKFGLTETELTEAVDAHAGSDGLRLRGVHVHVGSQLGAVDAWRDGARRALAVLALVRGGLDDFDTLDLGGGFPVGPVGEPSPAPERFARELPALIDVVPPDRRPRRLAIEPGRVLVARAGWLVARVLHVRDRGRRRVVLDAGMTELIRPALYGAVHGVVALTSLGTPLDPDGAGAAATGAGGVVDVHGPICESTDALGEHRLPPLRRGDLVAIRDAGAYATSLGSTYNGRPRPPQVAIRLDGGLGLLRRRGTLTALG